MQNYVEWLEATGITQKIMVQILRPYFPSFTKSICSVAMKPKKYGLSLCPEAETVLTETFGPAPGLAYPPDSGDMPVPKKSRENRTRGNRITVWMRDDLYMRLISLKTEKDFPTMQALAEAALMEFIENHPVQKGKR